jgi:CarboxypepD_reg-like domain
MKNLKLILALFLFTQINYAQDRRVSGVVNDDIGLPFPKVKVLVEGTNNYTITDMDGNFSIKANQNDFLLFSFDGMVSQRTSALGILQKITLKMPSVELIYRDCVMPEPWRKQKNNSLQKLITVKKFIRTTNPQEYFNKNAIEDFFIIFVNPLYYPQKEDLEFEEKYNIHYQNINKKYKSFYKKYNKYTFAFLNNKYDKTWQIEVSNYALGLKQFLK